MELLSLNDLRNLNQGIQKIYTLDHPEAFGLESLKIVSRLVQSDVPVFHITNTRSLEVIDTFLPDCANFIPPHIAKLKTKYLDEHPILKNMAQAIHGAYKISDFASTKELHYLEGVYQQFLRVLNMEEQMTLFLPPSTLEPIMVGFAFNRSERGFTERDRFVLNLLRPHLIQSYEKAKYYQKLYQSRHEFQQILNDLGAITINSTGYIQSIAPQATRWLETYYPKPTLTSHLPDCLQSWVKQQIENLTQPSELANPSMITRIQCDDRELTIRLVIQEIGKQYVLLLSEKALSLKTRLQILGLSAQETNVLATVMQEPKIEAIATEIGISPSTARKHLENIRKKLGVNSIPEAIAHALTQLGLYNRPSSN
jgi:DNA-binding CsgD family transcriptional regulator